MEQRWCSALTALTERKLQGLPLRFDLYITDRLTRSETSVIHLNLVAALAAAQIIFLTGIEATQNKVILRYSYLWIKSIQRTKRRKQDWYHVCNGRGSPGRQTPRLWSFLLDKIITSRTRVDWLTLTLTSSQIEGKVTDYLYTQIDVRVYGTVLYHLIDYSTDFQCRTANFVVRRQTVCTSSNTKYLKLRGCQFRAELRVTHNTPTLIDSYHII